MRKVFTYCTLLFLCISFSVGLSAQQEVLSILWQKTIGGTGDDILQSVKVTKDKGIIVSGYSKSNASGNKTENAVGGYDFWVVKMDGAGHLIWQKTFGGNNNDFNSCVYETKDGGFIIGGTSISDSSGSKSDSSWYRSNDFWVIKLDASGHKLWDRTLGGAFSDKMTSVTEMATGGIVTGGYSYSDFSGTKKSANLGAENNSDYWITILGNETGSVAAQNVYGGSSTDVLTCLSPAAEGGIYTAGYSYSIAARGQKSDPTVGNSDYWIVRTDTSGRMQWQGNFGGSRSDFLTCFEAMRDSSLVFGGYSNSPASFSKTGDFIGVTDFWIIRLNADMSVKWDKTLGGALGDYLMSIQQTSDKGFILGGYSNSNKSLNKTDDSKGGYDYWIVKLDSLGNQQWDKTIGGTGDDKLAAVYEAGKEQYIVAGTSNSPKSGDKDTGTIGDSGANDYWIMRLGKQSVDTTIDTTTPPPVDTPNTNTQYVLRVVPNPVSNNQLTIQYRTDKDVTARLVLYTIDGKVMMNTTLPGTTQLATHNFNIANLPKGSYYFVMRTDGKQKKITSLVLKQ